MTQTRRMTRSMTNLNMYDFIKENLSSVDKTILRHNSEEAEKVIEVYFTIVNKIIEVERTIPEKNDIIFKEGIFFNTVVNKTFELEYNVKTRNMKHHFEHFRQVYKGLEFIAENRGFMIGDNPYIADVNK